MFKFSLNTVQKSCYYSEKKHIQRSIVLEYKHFCYWFTHWELSLHYSNHIFFRKSSRNIFHEPLFLWTSLIILSSECSSNYRISVKQSLSPSNAVYSKAITSDVRIGKDLQGIVLLHMFICVYVHIMFMFPVFVLAL